MSYTKLTDFAVKDSLLSGNPAKVIRGTEIDAEFNAIAASDAQNITPAIIVAATSKATPVDADLLPLVDSAASNTLKKLTWANLKATVKTYIEAGNLTLSGTVAGSNLSGTNTGDNATNSQYASDYRSANFVAGTNYVAPGGALGTPASGTLTNCTVDGTNLLGYQGIPQNSQSAAYTLVITDAGKHILHPSADTTARIFTIPANDSVAFPIGTAVTFVNQNAGGVITIAITTDTMRLAGAGTTGSRTLAANGVATAVKLTATEWIISGMGLS